MCIRDSLGHVLQPNWGHKLVGNEYLFVNDSTVEGTVRTQGWAHFHSVSYRITFSEPIETLYQYIDGNLRKDSLFLRLNTPDDLTSVSYTHLLSGTPRAALGKESKLLKFSYMKRAKR